jgi:uncharacterized membrane protein YkvA (DUF1232 family)
MSVRAGRPSLLASLAIRGVGLLHHLPRFARLYWRLMRDPRVSIWPKALLVIGVVYVLSPLDLIPDLLLGIGQLDDAVMLIVLLRLFVYLCPADIVREHVRRIGAEGR